MTDDWDDEDDFDDFDDFDEDPEESLGGYCVCPNCGVEVDEEANVCPACGDYIIPRIVLGSDARPMWYIALGMIGIIAVLLVLSGAIRFLFG
jgi:hypothetical protein